MTAVGVVVPAFRPDIGLLAQFVDELDERLECRIRIEIDDPEPGVVEELRGLPATIHAVDERRGKGAAITHGFEHLDTPVLAFADADGSTPPASVCDVIAPVTSGEADLAVGSRRHPNADVRSHQTFARRHLGDGFAWIARRLLDAQLYDYQCGAKAITTEAWGEVREHIYEPGFAWDIELIAMTAALGYDIREVPVTWVDQPNSTVSPIKTSAELGLSLLRARHRAKRVAGSRLHEAIAAADESALIDRRGQPANDD